MKNSEFINNFSKYDIYTAGPDGMAVTLRGK
jgi:hypothetical protein